MSEAHKLYSLLEVERETGVPQRSVLFLLEYYNEAIPFLVDGTRRRFPSEAIPVIAKLWREYTRGISEEKGSHPWHLEIVDALLHSLRKAPVGF